MKNAFLGAFIISFGYAVFLALTSAPLPTSISGLITIALWSVFTNLEDESFPIKDTRFKIGVSITLCVILGLYFWNKL